MLSSVTSQLKASIQQHVPRYASQTSQQSNNLTLPQVPPPWMVQWSSSHSDWLYVNQETNQQSWVHPNQRPPQQSHDPYQSNIFSAPLAHQSQSTSQNPAFSPPPPQQHWQPDHQNPSFCPPSQESYPLPQQQSYSPYHPTASPSPPQQSQGRPAYQGFPIQPLPQVIPQSLSRPQHLYTTFPSWTSQEKPPHSIAPARKSRNGRNIVLGLGALVASAIGVDMLSDSDDEDSGDSGGLFSVNDCSSSGTTSYDMGATWGQQNGLTSFNSDGVAAAAQPCDYTVDYGSSASPAGGIVAAAQPC